MPVYVYFMHIAVRIYMWTVGVWRGNIFQSTFDANKERVVGKKHGGKLIINVKNEVRSM